MARVHMLDLFVPLVLLGCATHHPSPGAFDANLITEDEIVASRADNAYDAIHKLRANFLSNRGKLTFYDEASSLPTVYVDDQRYGDFSLLRTIPAQIVATIRLYRSWDATTRYGTNNMAGVIAITTRQGGDSTAAWRDRH